MLIDLEENFESFRSRSRATVCIAGAGVAGLFVATRLAEAGVDVHLLEAGGLTFEDRSQRIYNAEMASSTHAGTTVGRYRVFGGSSTRWGGQLLPYTPDVFRPPELLPSLGWPVALEELTPHYEYIEEALGVNHLPYTTELFDRLGSEKHCDLEHNSEGILRFSKWAPFSHRNLGQTLGKRAIASSKITVFIHANLTECLLSADGSRIKAFLVRNYQGHEFRFEADEYVLATGTIETSRVLLASRSVCSAGVGNFYDCVGRGLHDHISAEIAELQGGARQEALRWFGPFMIRGTTHVGRLEATPRLRERLGLLAVQAHFTIKEPEDSGFFVLRDLLRSMQRGNFRSALISNLPKLPSASLDLARLAWAAKVQKRRAISSRAVMPLEVLCEQLPQAGNRIRLADSARDELGMLKTIVDWRVSSEEVRSIVRFAHWLREKFERLGAPLSAFRRDLAENPGLTLPDIRDTNHPMGGTLMGTNPHESVVDADLKIHGVANMYIASCSTYPSGGSSNPTFTLMALSVRMADQLAMKIGRKLSGRSTNVRFRSATLESEVSVPEPEGSRP